MARVFFEIGINETEKLVKRLAIRSNMVAKNASSTEERAGEYLASLKGEDKLIRVVEGINSLSSNKYIDV